MNLNDEPMTIDFKRDDDTYIQLMGQLSDEGVYSVGSDEQGDFLDIMYEPEFIVWGVPLSGAEENRLEEQLRDSYWDYQEDYVL